MATPFVFQFGVEIELLLGSRSKTHKSWKSLASELSTRLAKAGIPNHLNQGNDKSAENYFEWSITQEVTVPAQAGKNLWGLELVSPIFTPDAPWTAQLHTIFTSVLRKHFVLTPSPHCSTHVHISTVPPLSAPQLASVAKNILYFEPALDALLPVDRASSYWCQSNRASTILKPLPFLPHCLAHLDACAASASTDAVVHAMCLFPASSAYGRAHGYTQDFVHGVWKWDFSGLLSSTTLFPSNSTSAYALATDYTSATGHEYAPTRTPTLEFRQPPGSLSASDAAAWVELGVSFVAGAVAGCGGGGDLDAGGAGGGGGVSDALMEELWWLLSVGAQGTGIGELRGVEGLFVQAGGRGRGKGKGGAGKGKAK
ncbi:putative amidoligase enzyme-domain-containing protein [Whalleya microplaca]|nr:putative amidoligase enzyme-domain-containing protein [Whalleya microplaca]